MPAKSNLYDKAGHLTSDGILKFTYSDRGRMATMTSSAASVNYRYNGLGERVSKVGPLAAIPSGANHYVYDEAGNLLGEYDAAGKALQETIYLDGVPILVVKYSITSLNGVSTTQTALFYIFADHLDAPRVITRATDNKIVWRWDNSDPFGLLPPNENPSSLGTFSYNPRFKGSLFDSESKLFYNYFRDYDPQIGRYVQSDPIGLDGGMNTYGYAMGNPMSFNDPTGLQTRPLRGPGNIPFLPLSKEAMEAVNRAYANEKAREDKITFQTYTRYNQITGQCYGGRTSGTGTNPPNLATPRISRASDS